MSTAKITTIGNSVGIVLPKEVLARLRAHKGDLLYIHETVNGIELTPYDPDFAEQVDIAEQIIKENRDVLKKLSE